MSVPRPDIVLLLGRLVAALRLDLTLYEEVSRDSAATSQAFRVVLLAGMSNGLGLTGRLGIAGILAGLAAALLGWLLWAGVIWLSAALLRNRCASRSLLRALGFANAPGVFLILGAVPTIGTMVRAIVVVWLLAATVRAVQAAFAVALRRALVISAIGFVAYLVLGLVSAHFAAS
jgi:Yip1 domain